MENENNSVESIPEYDFDVIEILKAGFSRIDGVKSQFLIAFLIYVAIAIVVQLGLGLIFPTINMLNPIIVTILSYPVLMPIFVGVMMMGIEYSRGKDIHFKSIFNYYHLTGKLALGGLLIYILTVIGMVLLVLPGIYLAVAYMFALPLMVDKNMGVWEAMEYSRKSVTKHWFKVFFLTLILAIVMVISAIPFGIGLVWTVPLMFVTTYGLLYPVMFDNAE